MPAAPDISRYNPSFYRFPVQNARTGYQPVYIPLILLVPGRKMPTGAVVENSDILTLKFYIKDAPDPSLVAGPEHIGQMVPSTDIYTRNISRVELNTVVIDVTTYSFYDPSDPSKVLKPYELAEDGDVFDYTTINGSINYHIPFYPDADYYDVSYFTLPVTDLPDPNIYQFVWETTYYARVVLDLFNAATQGPFCIGDTTRLTRFVMNWEHPGFIHYEITKKTPPLYFNEGVSIQDNELVKMYRILADVLQDIGDEQEFLNGINQINKIPTQLLPYLSFLIGWDLPNFPGATDTLRRAILRYAVELQKLKGSNKSVTELFSIFGFEIDLLNLWYSTDGKILIGPNERIPVKYADEKIVKHTVCQIDPIFNNYDTPSFGTQDVPLVYEATSNISLVALLVTNDTLASELGDIVTTLSENPDLLVGRCAASSSGFINSSFINEILVGDKANQILMYSEVLIDRYTGKGVAYVGQQPPIINVNVSFNKLDNKINMVFDHYLDFKNGEKLFMFALYNRDQIDVPTALDNLRSNKFDIEVFSKEFQESVDSKVIQYLMNFLYRLKAFHSQLRKIIITLKLLDVYNVTDYCSPFNRLQQPPPSLPSDISSCPTSSNNKDSDLQTQIYNALIAEHAAWKNLDGTHSGGGTESPSPARLGSVGVNTPEGESCQFTQYGQDMVLSSNLDLDHNSDTRDKVCDLVTPAPDFCFKGRVKDEIDTQRHMVLPENVRCKPCPVGMGYGSYWQLPTNELILNLDGYGSFTGQTNGRLKNKIRSYNHPTPEALRYTNRRYFNYDEIQKNTYLAYRRPDVDIQKDNLLFPSHKLPAMNKLQSDFTTNLFNQGPFDYVGADTDLNAHLVVGTDGDQYLVYDQKDYSVEGNGLIPDISSLGSHDDRSFQVTHKVYMVAPAAHPAIESDDSVTLIEDPISIEFDSSVPFDPIFRSYNRICNKDYLNGYPSEYGRYSVDSADFDYSVNTHDDFWGGGTGTPDTLLFKCGSMILVTRDKPEYGYYKPYRSDCDCFLFPCDTGGGTVDQITGVNTQNVDSCSLTYFLNDDGTYDWNCDKLELERFMNFVETIDVCSYVLDGEIGNMLCIIPGPDIALTGSIFYKDAYDTIYESTWSFIATDVLEVTLYTKIPYIWGQPQTGFVKNGSLYKNGIITMHKVRIRLSSGGTDGAYTVLAEWFEQNIGLILMNPKCGTTQYSDNFCYHVNCSVSDSVELVVSGSTGSTGST